MLCQCGLLGGDKVSLRVIDVMQTLAQNEITRKETSGLTNAVFHKDKNSADQETKTNHLNSPAVKTDVNRIFLVAK